jgi:putative phage-type endonuclease
MTATADHQLVTPTAYVVSTAAHRTPEWHAARAAGIGGSEIVTILGLSRYDSPVSLWLEKTGQIPPEPAGEAADMGLELEPVLRRLFTKRTGIRLERPPGTLARADAPHHRVNLDALTAEDPPGIFEGKAPGLRMAPEWTDEDTEIGPGGQILGEGGVPVHALVQVLWGLHVTGYEHGYIGCLLGGQEFRWKRIDRDQDLIDLIVERADAFWAHVMDGTPPPTDGHAATAAALGRLFDADPDATVVLDPDEITPLLKEYTARKHIAAEAEAALGEIENRLRALLGDAEVGVLDGRNVVTWKQNGTFSSSRFKAEHPDAYARYLTTRPAVDTKALAAADPDTYRTYRARVLRVPGAPKD